TDTVAGACTHGAAMRGHCLTYHGEPQSGSAGLEREVRLEQAIDAVDRDAVARVCDRHLHTRIARTDAYRELAARRIAHCFDGVADQVPERALERIVMCDDERHVGRGEQLRL